MNILIEDYIRNLRDGEKLLIKHENYKILLICLNGNYFAIDAICTHEDESLENGTLLDDCIECPRHGALFDLKSGAVKALPAVHPIKTYEIVRENNQYMIKI